MQRDHHPVQAAVSAVNDYSWHILLKFVDGTTFSTGAY
jgi:hypothetical protein